MQPRTAALALASLVPLALAVLGALPPSSGPQDAAAARERGRYLVHEVALCVQCHSPRDAAGELVPQRLLHGAAVPVESPWRARRWAFRAPHIAGLPGYTRAQAVRLLTEGVTARGGMPMAPMPPYRMTPADAEAVVDYLLSVD